VAIARRRRKSQETTAEAIEREAIELFYKQGFRATSLRQIADRVGIQVGSLYNHISAKGDLLFRIMEQVMLDLLEEQRVVAGIEDVVERMRSLVYHHVRFHGERAQEVFIGNSELRSLGRAQRGRILSLRNEYEKLFQKELEDGMAQGKFLPVDVKIVSYGLIAMATWVSSWYSPRGRLSLAEIADIYAGLALRGIWNPVAGSLDEHLAKCRDAADPAAALAVAPHPG